MGMQCHASNLLITSKGVRAAVFFAGTRESDPDTGIWYVTGTESQPFRPPRCMIKTGMVPHWNPVLVESSHGVDLFFKTGTLPSTWTTYKMPLGGSAVEIEDEDGIARGPVRSSILKLSNGDWLAPSSHEVVVKHATLTSPALVVWDSFVDISKDEGKTWERTEFIPYDRKKFGKYGGVIQPTMWESLPGQVHMLLRSTIGKLCRSDSNDYGKTWSPVEETDLPNNNSGVDVAKNPKTGVLALVYNPVGADWGARTPISVAFSLGRGKTWFNIKNIESGYGSFSYPSVAPLGDGFAVTYTWNRLRIAYVEFDAKSYTVGPTQEVGFSSDIEETVNTQQSFRELMAK